MPSMRAAVLTGVDQFELTEVPIPEVPDGWALVRVARVGLCGSDFGIFHGIHPRAKTPLIMGHEISGWVEVATGGSFAPGQLVVAEPLITCGQCWACRHNASHVCSHLGLYGIDAPGGFAEFVAIPVDRLHAVPDGVDVSTATLVEPLAVAVHAVRNSGLEPGDTVAVFGGGPIGVLTALVSRMGSNVQCGSPDGHLAALSSVDGRPARRPPPPDQGLHQEPHPSKNSPHATLVAHHHGAGQIIVVEPNPERAEVVGNLGFQVTPDGDSLLAAVAEATDGEGADVVFDSAGHPGVADFLLRAARPRGTIVIVGVHKQPVPLDLRHVNFLEQRLQGARVYTGDDVAEAVDLAASGVLPLAQLPVQTFALADIQAAFAAAMAPGRTLKVMVRP